MRSSRTALLLTLLTSATLAQTPATPVKKPATTAPTTHATGTGTHPAATTAVKTSKDSPPGVPKVVGLSKPLYALRYIDTLVGKGPVAQPSILGTSQADSTIMMYTVHYTGWLTDGTKFDSSVDRGSPITFPAGLHRVIPGWDSGFEGMHVGGKRRLFIPYQLAYGDSGRPPTIPPKSDLIFDIELVSQAEAPKTPPPAARPPAEPSRPDAAPANPGSAKPDSDKPTDSTPPPADPTKPTAEPAKPQ